MTTNTDSDAQTGTVTQNVLPPFPRLTGPLGRIVEAITPDIPYEYKALSVLTYAGLALSGRTQLSGGDYDNLQPRFYACLVGPPGSGKSAANNEVKTALKGLGKVHVQGSINSGPALVMVLKEHPRLLYLPDEATGAFDKAKHGRMFSDILHLLEENTAEHRVRDGETVVSNAHFAMVLTATPRVFADMWTGTGGASSGLQSRFVLSVSEARMPQVKTGNDSLGLQVAMEELKVLLDSVPPEIILPERKGDFTRGLIGDGVHIDGAPSRVVDMGKRFALVYAACAGKTHIDDETMTSAAAFINYQIAAFDRLMPTDAWTWVQRFENRILKYFEKYPGTHSLRDVRLYINPRESQGGFGVFKKAFDNLVNTKELICNSERNRSGYELWRLNPDRVNLKPRPTVFTPNSSQGTPPAVPKADLSTTTLPTVESIPKQVQTATPVEQKPSPTVPAVESTATPTDDDVLPENAFNELLEE